MLRILVTGSSGFIGGNLVDFLLSEGHTVRGLEEVRRESGSDPLQRSSYEELIGDMPLEKLALNVLFTAVQIVW